MASNGRILFDAVLIVIVTVGTATLVNTQWAVDDSGCRTPRRGIGNCILVSKCQPILDVVLQIEMLTQDAIEMLQNYMCGVEKKKIKVCCPNTPILPQRPTFKNPLVEYNDTNHENMPLLPNNCGVTPLQNYITYGEKTSLFEFPWMALLSYNTTGNDNTFLCGGTLINEMYILTAAHCISHTPYKLISVRLGEHTIDTTTDCIKVSSGSTTCAPPVQDIEIAAVIPHPKFNLTSLHHDIGLIRLASPANISVENVKPICLPTESTLRYVDMTDGRLIATGWGATESGRSSSELLKVDLPVISQSDCQKAYNKFNKRIHRKQLCAGGVLTDSCKGDSGGPLQKIRSFNNDLRFVQYGVVSYGANKCGHGGVPGVYTRVDYYMDWILNNLSD